MRTNIERLNDAIQAIYPDIENEVRADSLTCEIRLWWELSACVLSSQVSYDLAIAMADEITKSNLLNDNKWDAESLYVQLKKLLITPVKVGEKYMRHRFYNVKAKQLAKCSELVYENASSLRKLLDSFSNHFVAREWLVKNMPGLGPKQASMFLRNSGVTYELAILDRHVLKYMSLIGIYNESEKFISSKKKYLHYEKLLSEYADNLNCKIGLLDWAIWIVMRVIEDKKEFAPQCV
jgi:N-glycosylase/DNA lyase